MYPRIAADYRHGFAVLKGLPCDVFLGAAWLAYLRPMAEEKYVRMKKGDGAAFIDLAGVQGLRGGSGSGV